MQKVGCTLIRDVRETRQSLPTGFTRRDPAPASHLALIILAELLRDLSRPESRADSDEVGSDLRLVLASEGDLATKNSLTHPRFFRRQQVGRGKLCSLTAFDEAFGEWEARTGDCRPPTLVPPGQGLAMDATDAQDFTTMALQEAWSRLRQRRRDKPDLLSPWHWPCPRKEQIVLTTLVDKLKLPEHGWTSVDNYWCPFHNVGTKCTVDTHTTFIPTEDHWDKKRAVLDSQAAVLKWMMDFPRFDTDREDGSGLEFECQLNTPSLARLYQLKALGRTNAVARRRTLLDKQDLMRMGADDFMEEGYLTTRGEWWVRARDEECSRLCNQCGRAWSARQVDREGWCASCRIDKPEDASRNDTATARHIGLLVRLALPDELNSMAAGGDVKKTVMTIPFLRTCITNMIANLEKRFTSDCNTRKALAQPEAP